MRLTKGENAPTFSVKDISGKTIRLEDYKGNHTLVAFFRYASCPFCNLRVHNLIERYDDLRAKGIDVIAFFESPKESILKYAGKKPTPFPIIPDPERKIYNLYGVETSWGKFFKSFVTGAGEFIRATKKGFLPGKMENNIAQMPADFFVYPDGKIHTAHYGNSLADHLPLKILLDI